jgi:ACS family tartrate transporter-like MFS transporter
MSTTLLAAPDPLTRAVRKNLLRVVPLLAVAYFFNYIDRSNVGFAALTMNHDLGLTNAQFGAAAGFFFLGYCLPSCRRWSASPSPWWG